jgi:nicotinamide riboside kinase
VTKVVNLYGGPNSGKSTTAAGLFYKLKLKHYHCEMVREYVKSWSWDNRMPGIYDQPYLFGKQVQYESSLYGKVDYIITDSPLSLSAFYEEFHTSKSMIKTAAFDFMKHAQENGVQYINIWLDMVKDVDERGRFGDKDLFKKISNDMKHWITDNKLDISSVPTDLDGDDRVNYIMHELVIKASLQA